MMFKCERIQRNIPVLFIRCCLLVFIVPAAISPKPKALFQKLTPEQTNIHFSNILSYNDNFNIYTYRNFYNGGGVAIGDVNNDGLPDIFFTANMESNKLIPE